MYLVRAARFVAIKMSRGVDGVWCVMDFGAL